jgi:hypothetical protein
VNIELKSDKELKDSFFYCDFCEEKAKRYLMIGVESDPFGQEYLVCGEHEEKAFDAYSHYLKEIKLNGGMFIDVYDTEEEKCN